MSVKVADRKESSVQYITTAIEIEVKVINLLIKMSRKYRQFFEAKLGELSIELVSCCEKANNIYVNSEERFLERDKLLTRAKQSLMALDVQLGVCQNVLRENLAYTFEDSHGESFTSTKAKAKLDKMSEQLGLLVSEEKKLLEGAIKKNKERMRDFAVAHSTKLS